MNLWVKRIALGLMAVVALFLFACLDEDNILGFRNQNSRLNVSYIEIPVESSILLFDSLRTSNYSSDPLKRLLVGSYNDPVFGLVETRAYTQFRPSNTLRSKEAGATFDSIKIHLHFDLYTYGSSATSVESFSVHELTEDMTFRRGNDYYTNSEVTFDPIPLGSGSQTVNPTLFKNEMDDISSTDTVITVDIKLNQRFGLELFGAWDTNSSLFTDFEEFSKRFKGLAIVGVNNTKVVGLSLSDSTRISLHYHTATDTLLYNFYISGVPSAGVASASSIAVDRSASALTGLNTTYTSFIPVNQDLRYIQSGVPVVTKINLSKFLEFADTIDNLLINAAELSISTIEEPSSFAPPRTLYMQMLNAGNRLKKFKGSLQDTLDLRFYSNKARTITNGLQGLATSLVSADSVFSVMDDTQQDFGQLTYNSNTKSYKAFITLFLQELAIKEEDQASGLEKSRFVDFVLYPGNPFASKSLNRMSFNKSNLKLKVYYTTPSNNQ